VLSALLFLLRRVLAWGAAYFLLALAWSALPFWDFTPDWLVALALLLAGLYVSTRALSHLRRVRLLADRVDAGTLGQRHRRVVELPFEAGEAFDLLEAAVRELPGAHAVEAARDSLQVRARIHRPAPYGPLGRFHPAARLGDWRNQVLATVTPGADGGRVTLICEPERAAWTDLLVLDDATNLENAEALVRALARRSGERLRRERDASQRTATDKELAEARLGLLHAQVEPHFLYNTLASAQLLTRQDPERAERMLGHLIEFLRRSLPRGGGAEGSLGDELDRSLAYLEILRIRMGERLQVQVDVDPALRALPVPPMMLQTLVENAIKHGLEPKPGGGTVWLRARRQEQRLLLTVADDGLGLRDAGTAGTGTGIGLRNVRERLRLLHGERAGLQVVANFPGGVAATLDLPLDARAAAEPAHA
jgi:hypothetical protein